MLIAYSLALPLFLVIRNLTSLREAITDIGHRKGLIFDREYRFWQTKKR